MRTRIVNREQLGYLASKLGLVEIMEIKRDLYSNKIAMKTIGGNALEALIGAIYLDKGFSAAREFVSQRLVGQYLDMEKLMATAVSHKALVMKWAQQNHRSLRFDIESQIDNRNDLHSVSLVIDDEIWFTEINHSRKKQKNCALKKRVGNWAFKPFRNYFPPHDHLPEVVKLPVQFVLQNYTNNILLFRSHS